MICSLGRLLEVFWWTFPQSPIHFFIHLFMWQFTVCVCVYIYIHECIHISGTIRQCNHKPTVFLWWSSSESEVRYHPAPCFSWLLVAFPSFVLSVQPLFWMFYRQILLHLFLFVMKYIWVHGQSTGPNKVGIFHGLPSAYLT